MNHKWNIWLKNASLIVALAIFTLGACAPAFQSDNVSGGEPVTIEKSMESPPMAPAPAIEMGEAPRQDVTTQTQERLVIKNSNLSIIVKDPTVSMDRISRMAEQMEGYVVSANMYKERASSGIEVPRVSITIRVPAEKLNEALAFIRAESDEEPQNESLSSQDVTNEYVDLQSRLKNLEAAEVELTRIMQEARRTEDVLSVYNQLVSIREQIEVIKGQIKYFEQSAAMSSISAELIADEAVQPIEIGGWKPEGVVKDAIEALVDALQFVVSAAIWVVLFLLPVLLVLFIIFVLPIILIIRAMRKRRARRKMLEANSTVSES